MLSELDLQVVHALQEAPRASWSEIGAVLGLEARTVARRYEQLRSQGLLVVTQTVGPRLLRQTRWALLRARTIPGSAEHVGRRLAQWPQATSVRVTDGSFQVYALLSGRASRAGAEHIRTLWEQTQAQIAQIPEIVEADVHNIIDALDVGSVQRLDVLSNAQVKRLRETRTAPAPPDREPTEVTEEDLELFTILSRDGRRDVSDCAGELGRSRSWVSRRMARLQADGFLDFIALIPDVVSSRPVTALIWAGIAPAELSALAQQTASLAWIGLMVVTTGPSNVFAVAHLPTAKALSQALEEIREICPSLVVRETQLSVHAIKVHTRITDDAEHWSGEAAQPYAEGEVTDHRLR